VYRTRTKLSLIMTALKAQTNIYQGLVNPKRIYSDLENIDEYTYKNLDDLSGSADSSVLI